MSSIGLVAYGTDTEEEDSPTRCSLQAPSSSSLLSQQAGTITQPVIPCLDDPGMNESQPQSIDSDTDLVRLNPAQHSQGPTLNAQDRLPIQQQHQIDGSCHTDESIFSEASLLPLTSSQNVELPEESSRNIVYTPIEGVDEHHSSDQLRDILISQGYLNAGFAENTTETCYEEPNLALKSKIVKFLELRSRGVYLNDRLVSTHAFRNPSIMRKLIEFLELDEIGSNFSIQAYNPHGFPPEAFYKDLAKAQENKPISVRPFPTTAAAATELAIESSKRFVSALSTNTEGRSSQAEGTGARKRVSKWE
ncbi:hypothetical protein BASA50_005494 [Batrachochytrium salamandrivorans]|uniref:PUB domain-containing protein n=1 Tax=Batrachochytrium salamandrivorans TaxID=1357716 RepID=A0ABQ8FCI0_9FUNG|nr:hypothetical protein BASA60_005051 [Batrachochytrium salamandrivorans]KAH6577730.1 hypothetical protein BASA62_000711 [Batrachochytrium salamandrivorans]KAH6584873.1 hypothetical protein BASA61_007241 [Batrachochytrium salamandrivorans]KAH6595914.1 hypothetical protein BASA50_005494 [Batrachochytrium salamandrivorans]KAH9249277.1 hypothetical protein BASA81_013004 [Batrachochytrium salamandrivorans]